MIRKSSIEVMGSVFNDVDKLTSLGITSTANIEPAAELLKPSSVF